MIMDSAMKRNLLLYLFVSAATFSFLVLNERAGISIMIFVVIQFLCLYLWAPAKKPLLTFLPLFVLALNSFLSTNTMWRIPNLFVALVLYSVMALWFTGQISLKKDSLSGVVVKPLSNMFEPFNYFRKPVEWGLEGQKTHLGTVKRIAIAMGIALPLMIFLLIMLARADAIFSFAIAEAAIWALGLLDVRVIFRIIYGIVIGFYLFGLLYYVNKQNRKNIEFDPLDARKGDTLIINIVLSCVLLIYTLFVVVQFRYLFAQPDNLPFGLNFAHYARRGFFELMILAAINISGILLTVWLTKEQNGKGAKATKALCLYLCAVTSVLLVSSFYRMWLYGADFGLTRMRFMVFGFLFFMAIGIIATFIYAAKPRFNIIAVYCVIALAYYMCLNIVPMDGIIARSQINRYFETGHSGVAYVLTLSPDVAPEALRLIESSDAVTRSEVKRYFTSINLDYTSWRQWNLSASRFSRLRDGIISANP